MQREPAVRRTVVAGSELDFMLVHGLAVAGTQREIGAAIAAEVLAVFPPIGGDPIDPLLRRARRRWAELHWPEHARRTLGHADALGVDPADDRVDHMDLVGLPLGAGCSALWCPPAATRDGHSRIGRNFDFRTGSVMEAFAPPAADGARPAASVHPPMMSRPYVIESQPTDGGLRTVVVAACDFTGCFEGINEAGLAVVLLADDESTGLRPSWNVQAGVHELQLPRLLLDRCHDVDEAIVALRLTKQYDQSTICHYLVADSSGRAFVWERDTHNIEHVVRAGTGPLCVTNYLLHRHGSPAELPADDPTRGDMYERGRALQTHAERGDLTVSDLDVALAAVSIRGGPPLARTLWHSTYDLDSRTITVDFYLGDDAEGGSRRSAPVTFAATSVSGAV
jgi:hypothetical protein